MKKKKQKESSAQNIENFMEEWDIGKGMGILPDYIPFTQNIGCVGGKTKISKIKKSEPNDEKEA
ncbi:hypothetical protein [Algoriphagus sp.]|uniref:hypothetical protein n=1 Tax=Algoriphagus sp. TaxID=1872435 RepID=UPI0025E2289D|nr:hypothetical protein [Algoriphagus sp.]